MKIEHFNIIDPQKISRLLTSDLVYILDYIEKAGYLARIVGGAVRNLLLHVNIADIDIATTALPKEIIKIFDNDTSFKIVPSGIDHGTVTLVYKKIGYEVTTLREDVKTFGRKAEVAFCNSFEIDSSRRDFTINALYMDKNGTIYDYHNSIDDIRSKTVRFIGNPLLRIEEDYLRILRYFRFVAYYGDYNFVQDYLTIINSMRSNLSKLSSERILSELLKIFALSDFYKILADMWPVLIEIFGFNNTDEKKIAYVLRYCGEKLEMNKNLSAEEKFCLFLKLCEESVDFNKVIQQHKLSRHMRQLLGVKSCSNIDDAKTYLKKINPQDRNFFITYLAAALFYQNETDFSESFSLYSKLKDFCESGSADFNFRAADIADYNLSNEELKKVMMHTKKVWLSSNKNMTKQDCIEIAQRGIKSVCEIF